MKLNSTFRKLSNQFREDFEGLAKEISHRASSGEARERALRDVLARFLPRRAALGSGFVIDAHGNESLQTDVIIYDQTVASVFEVGGVGFYPCETVIAVGEVKSQIDSADDLKDALSKIHSVKVLDRSNSGTNELVTGPGISLQPMQFNPAAFHRDQILGFAFTGGSMSQDAIVRELRLWNGSHPRAEWPNVYCDYTRFLISYEGDEGLGPSAMDAKSLYCTDPEEVPDLLLLFVCTLATFVNHAHIARPKYFDYAEIGTTQHTDYPLVLPLDSG